MPSTNRSPLPRWARARRGSTGMPTPTTPWRLHRALSRIEPALVPIVAAHARDYFQRPWRREVTGAGSATWTIDGERVLELQVADRGPATLVVHDFSLLHPLRKAVRTGHVRLRMATARDAVPSPVDDVSAETSSTARIATRPGRDDAQAC